MSRSFCAVAVIAASLLAPLAHAQEQGRAVAEASRQPFFPETQTPASDDAAPAVTPLPGVENPEPVNPGAMIVPVPSGQASPYGDLSAVVGDQYPGQPVISSYLGSDRGEAWIGGVSTYVLKPHWSNNNTAFLTTNGMANGRVAVEATNFSYGFSASPGFWFGYVNRFGNGIRTNFFSFNQSTSAMGSVGIGQAMIDPFAFGSSNYGVFTIVPGTTLWSQSALQVTTWDIEAIKRVNTMNWNWTAAAGVRYMYLNQSYGAQIDPSMFAVNGASSIFTRHFFNGAGPTLAMNGRRPIADTPLGIFGGGRGSLLFGNSEQRFTQTFNAAGQNSFHSADWGVIPVGELEFGVDFRRPLGAMTLVIENALLGQVWLDAGTSSNTAALAGNFTSASMGLYGLRSSIGLTY
jgi:hypothetical protein